MEEEKDQVVIELNDEVEAEETFDTDGLLPEEVELAKEHGLVKEEDGEHEEQPEPEAKEDTGDEEKPKEEEEEVENPTFEQVEEKEELIEKYNKNEKALYWRWKSDKQKRQAAQKELEELKGSSELQTLKESVSAKKLAAINEALADPELTVEKLQAIITGKKAEDAEERKYTKEEFVELQKQEEERQKKQQETFVSRIQLTEQIGRSKYENFDDIVGLAQEVVNDDTTGVKKKILSQALTDTNIDEDKLADIVVEFAQFNPKFKELGNKVSPEEKEKVDRAVENSKKRTSSAALARSGGGRAISEEDLTPEDASSMNLEQWNKLKPETRKRLLGG